MKVTVNHVEAGSEDISYPVLMEDLHSPLVVLFIEATSGLCVVANNYYNSGDVVTGVYAAGNTKEWKKFEGTITLENE